MKRVLSLLFILNLSNIFAQQGDSLLRVSLKLNSDTDRVNFFCKEGFAKRAIDPFFSFDCARLAESFAKGTKLPFYMAKANNLLGILHSRRGDLVNSLVYHKRALALREKINDKRGLAITYLNLGNTYADLKHFQLAESAYKNGLNVSKEINDLKQVRNCLQNLGALKLLEAEVKNDTIILAAAADYFSQAEENTDEVNDYELRAFCLSNKAIIHINMKKYDEAIADCENSLKARDMMDDEMGKSENYLNLALAYFLKQDNEKANENLKLAEAIINKYDYLAARITMLKIKADHFASEEKMDAAYVCLQRHYFLKDSLGEAYKSMKLENEYSDLEPGTFKQEFKFPYFLLNVLLIGAALIILFVFKNRR
jgi:tetratricopeptide (TPR) repeat protein